MRWKGTKAARRSAAFYSEPATVRPRWWKRAALAGAVLAATSWMFAAKNRRPVTPEADDVDSDADDAAVG